MKGFVLSFASMALGLGLAHADLRRAEEHVHDAIAEVKNRGYDSFERAERSMERARDEVVSERELDTNEKIRLLEEIHASIRILNSSDFEFNKARRFEDAAENVLELLRNCRGGRDGNDDGGHWVDPRDPDDHRDFDRIRTLQDVLTLLPGIVQDVDADRLAAARSTVREMDRVLERFDHDTDIRAAQSTLDRVEDELRGFGRDLLRTHRVRNLVNEAHRLIRQSDAYRRDGRDDDHDDFFPRPPRDRTTTTTVVCESNDFRTAECAVARFGGVIVSARLVSQYSKAGCYQGSTWDYDSTHIRVSNGCRGLFEVQIRR